MTMLIWIIAMALISIVIGLVTVSKIIHAISEHVSYYLPPITIAKLSKELNAQLRLVEGLRESWIIRCESMDALVKDLQVNTAFLDMIEDRLTAVLEYQLREWLSGIEPQLLDDLIRQASAIVANRLEKSLMGGTTALAGEYVLLQSVDELDLSVQLEARYTDAVQLREALIKVLEWQPAKAKMLRSEKDLAEQLINKTKTQHELDLLLGKLGSELLNLKWKGALALRKGTRDAVLA